MQNYTTIDKYSLSPEHYLKLSHIHTDPESHFVVALYREAGDVDSDTYTCELLECWHFIGVLAEVEATNFYCAQLPELAEDFPPADLSKYSSYVPSRHFKANKEGDCS